MPNISIWSPDAHNIAIEISAPETRRIDLTRDAEGMWTCPEELPAGTRYLVSLDGGPLLPDPRAMSQPEGAHGPSEVVDPATFEWNANWVAPDLRGKVFYELHIGTFTPEGTFRAAIDRLDYLADLGVDCIELMPIAPMPGDHGWGYDGVQIFALHAPYGTPEDLVALVDAAHARGIAVCLDVVYNHFGPDGNYLGQFGPYFTDEYDTPWGSAVNFAEPQVRKYVIDNALQWLRDYRMDALRLDATDYLIDDSAQHIMAELSDRVAELAASTGQAKTLTAEADVNQPSLAFPTTEGGRGMDVLWMDDFHHALHVWLTNESYAYYQDHTEPGTLNRTFTNGYTRTGQYSKFRDMPWGAPVPEGMSGHHFMVFDENHDQVGNRLIGDRTSEKLTPGELAISRAVTILSPYTVMLFQGEEWATKQQFPYFTDHGPEIGAMIKDGRLSEFAGWDFDAIYGGEEVDMLDPQAAETFHTAKLPWDELSTPEAQRFHSFVRELIAIRRENPDVATGDRSRTEAHVSDLSGWLRRGNTIIVFAQEPGVVTAPVTGKSIRLTWEPVEVDGENVTFEAPGVAVFTA